MNVRECVMIGVCISAAAASGQERIYGVTDSQSLVSWEASDPGSLLSGVAIQGLMSNETVRGIDFRPANNELYALGSFNNLYTIDINSGVASRVNAAPFAVALNGSSFGFDFNPVIDRIRVVSDANQNLVVNPNDGTNVLVTSLFYQSGDVNQGTDPNVVASAYTNSVANAMSTQLFGIDTGLDVLVTQANSAGTLGTVGGLGVDVNDNATFDISGDTGIAYLTVEDTTLSRSTFWTIDLATGQAAFVGEIGGGALITSTAIAPGIIPSPATALPLAGLAGLSRRRR